jgi:hypothetical protein
MKMLEQTLENSARQIYRICELENLSASVLYNKDKMETGVDVAEDGTAYKFYTDISPFRFGFTELGIQGSEESHKSYSDRMKSGGGIPLSGNFSSGNGY